MSETYEICRCLRHLEGNPRDRMGVARLRDALRSCPAEQFRAQARDHELGSMIYRAAGNIVEASEGNSENTLANWISVAGFLVRRMEKPKRMPAATRKPTMVDLKARAAGEGG